MSISKVWWARSSDWGENKESFSLFPHPCNFLLLPDDFEEEEVNVAPLGMESRGPSPLRLPNYPGVTLGWLSFLHLFNLALSPCLLLPLCAQVSVFKFAGSWKKRREARWDLGDGESRLRPDVQSCKDVTPWCRKGDAAQDTVWWEVSASFHAFLHATWDLFTNCPYLSLP